MNQSTIKSFKLHISFNSHQNHIATSQIHLPVCLLISYIQFSNSLVTVLLFTLIYWSKHDEFNYYRHITHIYTCIHQYQSYCYLCVHVLSCRIHFVCQQVHDWVLIISIFIYSTLFTLNNTIIYLLHTRTFHSIDIFTCLHQLYIQYTLF